MVSVAVVAVVDFARPAPRLTAGGVMDVLHDRCAGPGGEIPRLLGGYAPDCGPVFGSSSLRRDNSSALFTAIRTLTTLNAMNNTTPTIMCLIAQNKAPET